jgi:hypothetical protein
VAVFQMSADTDGTIDDGWLRYLLDQVWHLPYHEIAADQIAAGALYRAQPGGKRRGLRRGAGDLDEQRARLRRLHRRTERLLRNAIVQPDP